MAAKVQGAWHLHQLTRELSLDHFVLFSSAASLIGAAGQGNYAAANAFLDAIAHLRHALRLPALSINWGVWSGAGLANREAVQQRLRQTGMATIEPHQGFEVLAHLLAHPSPQVGVLPVAGSGGAWARSPFSQQIGSTLSDIAAAAQFPTPEIQEAQAETAVGWLEQIQQTAVGDRLPRIQAYLREQVAIVLGILPSQLTDPHQGFTDLGLDSLTSVELRNRLQASLERPLPATLVYDYPTLADLTHYVATTFFKVGEVDDEVSSPASLPVIGPPPSAEEQLSNPTDMDLQNLSEAEAEALLLKELRRLEG